VAENARERCEFIRWKGLFLDHSESGSDTGTQEDHERDHIYWCMLTMNCLGPDGQVADGQTCNSFRSCYKPV
jgi:hypothetical protein